MQVKLFTIPVGDNGNALQEMNTFLRGNKILEVENQLISNDHGAYWCFCVRYIERTYPDADSKKTTKVDYRKVLDEATFQKFAKLREIRKKIAVEQAISAFIIFTDEELAELANLEAITTQAMLGIKGIGEKKIERFGKYFTTPIEQDETPGQPDSSNNRHAEP